MGKIRFFWLIMGLLVIMVPVCAVAKPKAKSPKKPSDQQLAIQAVRAWQKTARGKKIAPAAKPPNSDKFLAFTEKDQWATIAIITFNKNGKEVGEHYNFLLKKQGKSWKVVHDYDEGIEPKVLKKLGLSIKTAKELKILVYE